MSLSENCNKESSVMNQDSKVNGKVDSIEGQLSFMGEGERGEQSNVSTPKEDSSFPLPTLSLFPKKFDDIQDAQDDLRNTPDLPNGHNNPDAVDIAPRTKSLDELLKESEGLPDTELIGCTKEFECKMETQEEDKKNSISISENSKEDAIHKPTGDKNVEQSSETSSNKSNLEADFKDRISQERTGLSIIKEDDPEDHDVEQIKSKSQIKSNTNDMKQDIDEDAVLKLELSDSQLSSVTPNKETSEMEITDESKNIDSAVTSASCSVEKEVNEEIREACNCATDCHVRMKMIKEYLANANNQLKGYIKMKKQDDLTMFLKLLNEIELLTENSKNNVVSQDLLNDAFQEEAHSSKKRKSRASSAITKAAVVSTPNKSLPEKKIRERDSKSEEPMSEINFKNLKGLAVFAKWPNSGWYYPGIIEGLTNSEWKEAANVTVKFYDGLVREMKNINILPAHLIPVGSTVCDLDDETEMVVESTNRIDNNSVEFTLANKEGTGKNLEANFNKLAIKANHMKSIKQQLERNRDVTPKQMHMVSLDNLVSGRRSRIRTQKGDDDENAENTTPRRVRKSSAVPDTDKPTTDHENLNNATRTPSKKREVTAVERTPKRTTTLSKRMKQ